MAQEQRDKLSKKKLSEANRNLMEREKAWDVALQRLADQWNAEEDERS